MARLAQSCARHNIESGSVHYGHLDSPILDSSKLSHPLKCSVHSGEIDLDEDIDLAAPLFPIMNMIVDRMKSEPKKVDEIYKRLPEKVRAQIDRRDKKTKLNLAKIADIYYN